MRGKILLLLLLFPLAMVAKKAPKWKAKPFKSSQQGIRYNIISQGKGDSVTEHCYVNYWLFLYDPVYRKYDKINSPKQGVAVGKFGSISELNKDYDYSGFSKAIRMLRVGGKGYFIAPPELAGGDDSMYFFIQLLGVTPITESLLPGDSLAKDSINFVMPDPDAGNYGDTLFTSAKLLKAPTIISCGTLEVTQVFEFQLSWFNNGVQHKNILVYIQCPDFYGKDYFVEGKSYIITAIPLTDNKKRELNTVDQFPNENVERYYLLRIK